MRAHAHRTRALLGTLTLHDAQHIVELDLRLCGNRSFATAPLLAAASARFAAAGARLAALFLLLGILLLFFLLELDRQQLDKLRPDVLRVAPRRKVIHLGEHVAEELAVRLIALEITLGAHLGARALEHQRDRFLVVRERLLNILPLHLRNGIEKHLIGAAEPLLIIVRRLCGGRTGVRGWGRWGGSGDFDSLHARSQRVPSSPS